MEKNELVQQLNELHQELQQLEDVDGEVVEALTQIALDIRDLAERQDHPLAGDQASELQQRVEQLEVEHPTAARFLSQMTDFLAMIGI